MPSFQGRVVLVTGANSGIGEAAVAAFAQAGATVFGVAHRHDAAELARARHPGIRWLVADVARRADVKAAVATAIDEAGRLDALVNNAGVVELAPIESSSEDMIRSHFDVNVFGLTYATQTALPALVASKGTIVNISSVAGHKPIPGASIYGASKAAVESLTRSWALELAPRGVRVNAIAPGPTDTAIFGKLPQPPAAAAEIKAQLTAQVPLGRMASADEIARWIIAFADPSVGWVTGAIVHIDGGMSLT